MLNPDMHLFAQTLLLNPMYCTTPTQEEKYAKTVKQPFLKLYRVPESVISGRMEENIWETEKYLVFLFNTAKWMDRESIKFEN